MKGIDLGKVGGLQLEFTVLGLAGSVALGVAAGAALAWFQFPTDACFMGGVLVVVFHWLSELLHQSGHAWAARRTGHPMVGIRLGTLGLLSTSVYPADEPPLPAGVHIRRALGGPLVSLGVTVFAALAALLLAQTYADLLWYVSVWVCFENAAVFTLGAFLPLPFTDGGTILRWWRQR